MKDSKGHEPFEYKTGISNTLNQPLEEVLEIIKKNALMPYEPNFDDTEIKEHYKVVEKHLKALEIIKEKEVNIAALLELDSLQQYNGYCEMVGGCKKLTQEEFDLIKGVIVEYE